MAIIAGWPPRKGGGESRVSFVFVLRRSAQNIDFFAKNECFRCPSLLRAIETGSRVAASRGGEKTRPNKLLTSGLGVKKTRREPPGEIFV